MARGCHFCLLKTNRPVVPSLWLGPSARPCAMEAWRGGMRPQGHLFTLLGAAGRHPDKTKGQLHAQAGVGAELAEDGAVGLPGVEPLEAYDFNKTLALVETAMLASVSGMATLVLSLLKLESYLFYILPFPLVLASLRSGPAASRKTLTSTFFLIFVLLGPVSACRYILLYGMTGITVGQLWTWRVPWSVSIPTCIAVFIVGLLGFVVSGSVVLRTNLFMLLINNVYSVVARLTMTFGFQAAPTIPAVVAFLFLLAGLRALFYMSILHVLYALMLSNMGYDIGPVPKAVERLLSPARAAGRR
eukprot:evm.model.scf_1715.1 EVM.evm.TU.scf_1715.1   scf_1715:1729-7878(-)